MTSIYKRGGRRGHTLQWVEAGRLRQKQFPTKRAAEEHEDRLRARSRAAEGLGEDVTLRAHATRWLEHVRVNSRGRTHEHYTWAMTLHILPALGNLRLRQITRTHVKDFLVGALQAARRPSHTPKVPAAAPAPGAPVRTLSRTTVARLRATLHACLSDAVEDQLIAANPAAIRTKSRTMRLAPTRAELRSKVKAFTREQLRAFLEQAKAESRSRYMLWRVMAGTGLRPGEAQALRWDDIDLRARRIHVCRSWSHRTEGATKSGLERDVDVGAGLAAELAAWDAATKASALESGRERAAPVFPNQVGKLPDDRRLQEVFKRVLKRAGLPPHYTPHCLRHTFASLMLSQGESVYYVQRQLGHATIRLTVDLYGSWLPAGNQECADRYDAVVFGGPTTEAVTA